MRIEGTYTFIQPRDRVFAALLDADTLARALPGCERLIQLGPADESGARAFEARFRVDAGAGTEPESAEKRRVTTAQIEIAPVRPPAHVRAELRGVSATGQFFAHGPLDLVERDGATVLAYAWAVEETNLSLAQRRALSDGAGRDFMHAFCERLAQELRAREVAGAFDAPEFETVAPAAAGRPWLAAQTTLGAIVALPPAAERRARPLAALAQPAGRWSERAAWMGAGLLIGVGLLLGAASLARWAGSRDA